jgi:two-component system, LuxR family, sensor kinase FixL
MNNVTIVWSVMAACALLLALMHAIIWIMDRKAIASLAFSSLSLSVVGVVFAELSMMFATTAQEWGATVRWAHIPVFTLCVSLLLFFKVYLRTGRDWLLWMAVAMRLVVLVVNFAREPNFNFERINGIVNFTFLGEQVSLPAHMVASSWQWMALVSVLLMLAYMADALATLWRTRTTAARRTVIVIGSATFVSGAVAALLAQLWVFGVTHMPVLMSPPFIVLMGAMAVEMSADTLRAARLSRELRDSEMRLELAADSAGLGLWSWDARANRLWATQRVREMFGLSQGESLELERLQLLLHAEDASHVREVLQKAAATGSVQEVRFRLCLPDGKLRWILGRGRSEANEEGSLTAFQGVLRDVTEQYQVRQENDDLRLELAHAERVSVLGRLSSSLAHELSQPLAAILHNTEAAEILLKGDSPDLSELRAIVADIQRDDVRAGEVIAGLRALFTRREMSFMQLPADNLVQGVIMLLRTDARERRVVLESHVEVDIPAIRGDRVHLSQVLINVIVNAMDAVAEMPDGQKRVRLSARVAQPGLVEFTVADSGTGIPDQVMQRNFEPFFTTKSAGMGMGLSVSRTIVEAHAGRLWAENNLAGGAAFHLILPAYETAQPLS